MYIDSSVSTYNRPKRFSTRPRRDAEKETRAKQCDKEIDKSGRERERDEVGWTEDRPSRHGESPVRKDPRITGYK